jgi:hypothetical protein
MLGQIRTLEGVDVDSLKVNAFEGCMAEGAPHKVPEPVATGPVSEGSTAYHGNCHCGAVAYTLLAPQKISKVTWCNLQHLLQGTSSIREIYCTDVLRTCL